MSGSKRFLSWALAGAILGLAALTVVPQRGMEQEIAQLQEKSRDLQRQREAFERLTALKREAGQDTSIHLTVTLDSGIVGLNHGAARLRRMVGRLGAPGGRGSAPDTVRLSQGVRRVDRVIGPNDPVELPRWVWKDVGQSEPAVVADTGLLGPVALMTTDGLIVYSQPSRGPLVDSSYVMPGAIRLPVADLKAIRASLERGTRVYFF